MTTRIKLRGDTAANWNRINPVLASREVVFDSTAQDFKAGDGVRSYVQLPYLLAQKVVFRGRFVPDNYLVGQYVEAADGLCYVARRTMNAQSEPVQGTNWRKTSWGPNSGGPTASVLLGGTTAWPDANELIDLSLKFYDCLDVPFDVRTAAAAGAYVDGELQGAQPVGSQAKMEFVTKNDLYKYTRGQLGTLVWVRLAGIKK